MIVLSPQFTGWWNAGAIRAYLDFVLEYYRIDSRRIYLTGLSAGSSGLHGFMNQDPRADDITAFVACAVRAKVELGQGDYLGTRTPYWALVEINAPGNEQGLASTSVNNLAGYLLGTAPTDVYSSYPGNGSSDYTASFNHQTGAWTWENDEPVNADSNLKLTLFNGNQHNSWTETYNSANMWTWLFSQQKPTIEIVSPIEGSLVVPSSTIYLQANVVDEDAISISGANVQWESNLDGNIGTGLSISVQNLSVGVHTISCIATDSSYRIGRSSVSLSVVHEGPFTAQIDVGSSSYLSPGWNNITDRRVGYSGSIINNMVTDTGLPIGVRVEVSDDFTSARTDGKLSNYLYPENVQRDNLYVDDSNPYGELHFSGLNPVQTYAFTFFASRAASGTRPARYTINGQSVVLEASENESNTVTLQNVASDASGEVVLSVERDNHNGHAYLGAVVITTDGITSVNASPIVNAGVDASVTLDDNGVASVSLSGTASDDGLPSGILVTQWSIISSPAGSSPVIANADLLQTTITFDMAGSYTLQISGDDSDLVTTDVLTITVNDVTVVGPAGATVFYQDFETSSVLADYVNTVDPTSGQFEAVTAEIDGGAWSIGSAGDFVHTRDGGSGGASFQRFTGLGNLLFSRLEFSVSVDGTSSYGDFGSITLGNWDTALSDSSGGSSVGKAFVLSLKARGSSDYYFRINGVASPDIATGSTSVSVVWFANMTGTTESYEGPDGLSYTIGDNTSDLWIDGVLVLDDIAREGVYTAASIKAFRFRANTSQAVTIRFGEFAVINQSAEVDDTLSDTLLSEGFGGVTIGTNSSGSSRILTTNEWEVVGSGSGLFGTSDSFYLEGSDVEGDFSAIICVKDLQSSSSSALAGLMIREGLASDARTVALATSLGNNYAILSRTVSGQSVTSVMTSETYLYPDVWLFIERIGDIIHLAVSSDGESFEVIDSISLNALASTIQFGLFSSSGDVAADTVALFDDFEFGASVSVFAQNFEGSTVVVDYFDELSPTSNQMNDISAEVEGGIWSIEDGVLQLARSGVDTGDVDGAGFMRYTDFPGVSSVLKIEFDMSVENVNTYADLASFRIGDFTEQRDYSTSTPSVSTSYQLTIKGGGDSLVRFQIDGVNSVNYIADGTFIHLVWYLNTSGQTEAYLGGDGYSYSLDSNATALWVNSQILFDNVPRYSTYGSSSLSDLFFRCPTTQAIVIQFDNFTVSDSL